MWARRVEPGARGGPGTRTQGALRDWGAPARSAHKETARPAGAGSARPLRDSRPPPTRALAPHAHRHSTPPARPGTPPRRAPPCSGRPGARRSPAAGSRRRRACSARCTCPWLQGPRRPSAASSAPRGLRVLPAGRPGRRGRAPRAGPGSAGSSGLGRAACALSPWSVHPRAGSAAPHLLCLTRRLPGAPPAPGRLAGSAGRGARAPGERRHRARRSAEQHCPAGAAAWALRGRGFPAPPRGSAAAAAAAEREGGERWGGAAPGAEGRWKGAGKWRVEGERQGVKGEKCRLRG